jgi:hypothetical protein
MVIDFAKRFGNKNSTQFFHLFPGIVNTNTAANQGFPSWMTYPSSFIMPYIATDPSVLGEVITYLLESEEFGSGEVNGSLVGPKCGIIKPSGHVLEEGLGDKLYEYSKKLAGI